jgi:hypothetical protein
MATNKLFPRPRANWRRNPTGLNEAAYEGYERWMLHRWAWEFLCRNDDFIDACQELGTTKNKGLSTEEEIARRFHLKKFKDYREDYNFQKPQFDFVRVLRCTADEQEISQNVHLHQGEVLIRFNVAVALKSSNALKAQLSAAEKVLESHARMLAQQGATTLPLTKARIGTVEERIRWLRMLDLTRHAKNDTLWEFGRPQDKPWSHAEIYRRLFADRVQQQDNDWCREQFKDAFRTAEKCAESTYLEMAFAMHKTREIRMMATKEKIERNALGSN